MTLSSAKPPNGPLPMPTETQCGLLSPFTYSLIWSQPSLFCFLPFLLCCNTGPVAFPQSPTPNSPPWEALLDIPAGFSRVPCSLSPPSPSLAFLHASHCPPQLCLARSYSPSAPPRLPPPGSTSGAQRSSDCGRRQTGAGLSGPAVTCHGTLGYVCSLCRPQHPCLKIRNIVPTLKVVRMK